MGATLQTRRSETEKRLATLREELGDAAEICEGKACVYATGSFARGEAHKRSDLDLFILGQEQRSYVDGEERSTRTLCQLDEIRLKACLINATRSCGIEDFSGDGEYLTHYTDRQLIKTLGKPEDDSTNAFTARLLLLLESKLLVGDEAAYRTSVEESFYPCKDIAM